MEKEKYLRLGLGLAAGLAALKFRKYRWIASALLPVVASGVQAALAPAPASARAARSGGRRRPDSSYL
jgi:hypothetical protein